MYVILSGKCRFTFLDECSRAYHTCNIWQKIEREYISTHAMLVDAVDLPDTVAYTICSAKLQACGVNQTRRSVHG